VEIDATQKDAVQAEPAVPIDQVWRDTSAPVDTRVEALIAEMTLDEKLAQLIGVWVGASADGGEVAPHQNEMYDDVDLDALLPNGLGQLTRPFGTAPVDPALGAVSLARAQHRVASSNRFGIPALAHEECLAGFASWGATAYPIPLSWGATFDPQLIERMAERIGADMRAVGVHQGLAPVLDVVRDARWGRVEETIGEDPFLVATVGTAYVRGLESAGIIATLKHFVGYSASRAGRNLAPVSIGQRELADVLLPPFEMAVRDGGARSVMNSYNDIDGVPSAADVSLLTGLLRDTWGFDGTVVADYFAVGFLKSLHGVAETWGDAAAAALTAGIDVELPTVKTYGRALAELIESGGVEEALVDRALRRVLRQKVGLGLLDPSWSPVPVALGDVQLSEALANPAALRGTVELDTAENRELAREIAEHAIVLLRNDGTLPLATPKRIAVLGPNAVEAYAVLGCYSFPSHVGVHHPEVAAGIDLPTLLDALREEFPSSEIVHRQGTSVDGGELDGIAEAVRAARDADVVVLALGDRAGLFGRGTSGEGCDVPSLELPGAQQALLDAVLASGTPTVVTLLSGRPYALGSAVTDAAAIVQTFFPGEEGTGAIAGVLSGRVNPSGRLPVSVPAHPGAQPSSYLTAPLGAKSSVSNIDPTPAYWFGHGLSYGSFEWSGLAASGTEFDQELTLSLTVRNTGERAGADVVQLYLHDPIASVVRPVRRLIAYHRLQLAVGETATVSFRVPADLASFTARGGVRIVEPGRLDFEFGRSAGDIVLTHTAELTGAVRVVDHTRALTADVEVRRG
jgi:beta-xylosidase